MIEDVWSPCLPSTISSVIYIVDSVSLLALLLNTKSGTARKKYNESFVCQYHVSNYTLKCNITSSSCLHNMYVHNTIEYPSYNINRILHTQSPLDI